MKKLFLVLTVCMLSVASMASYADQNKLQSQTAVEGAVADDSGSSAMNIGSSEFTAPNLLDNPDVNND